MEEQIAMEYEDEPMDINETTIDGYFEEGEINSSGDEKSIVVPTATTVSGIFTRNTRNAQKEGFVTGLNIFDQDEAQKKLDRAKRFSLPLQVDSAEEHNEKLTNLYKDLRIDKENERHYRFNAIHLRGTENMSTEDVLEYFMSYAPSHVEWINDISCNVVWSDDISAARALLNLSKKMKNLEKVHSNADPFEKDFKSKLTEYVDSDDAVDAMEIKTAIPPGYWRIGVPCKKSSSLLLRYATRSDKKQRNAEKSSEYYRKYGNPHFGNIPGLISNSLRTGMKKYKIKGSDSNYIWNRSAVEELEKKNPWEELAYEWGKMDKTEEPEHRFVKSSVRERVNSTSDLRNSLKNIKERQKRMRLTSVTSQNLSEKEPWESRSKIPRMKMYADDEEERLKKTLERRLQSKRLMEEAKEDLRSKINRKKNRTRLKFRTEKKKLQIGSSKESSNSENEYDDGDSGDWALEHYHDLRQSLEQSKRQELKRFNTIKYESDSDDEDNDEDSAYLRDFSRRSPLQIEIENDEYYLKKKQ